MLKTSPVGWVCTGGSIVPATDEVVVPVTDTISGACQLLRAAHETRVSGGEPWRSASKAGTYDNVSAKNRRELDAVLLGAADDANRKHILRGAIDLNHVDVDVRTCMLCQAS
eukprot:2237226-Amphidinium_carterae.1